MAEPVRAAAAAIGRENKRRQTVDNSEERRARRNDGRGWKARGIILGFVAEHLAIAGYILSNPPQENALPGWNRPVLGYSILGLSTAIVAVVLALVLLRIALHRTRGAVLKGVKRLVLCLAAVCIFAAIFDVVLTAFPALQISFADRLLLWPHGQPFFIEDERYGFKGKPCFEAEYRMDSMKGLLLPAVNPDRLVETGESPLTILIKFDRNGFMNDEVPDHADIVLVGDSFALHGWTPPGRDWLSMLRRRLNLTWYNLSLPGFGPLQESEAVREYAFRFSPDTVIWSFFEGNDLQEAGEFENYRGRRAESGITWLDHMAKIKCLPVHAFPYNRPVVRLLLHLAALINPPQDPRPDGWNDLLPLKLTAGGRTLPHALYDVQLCRMSMTRDEITASSDWQLTARSLISTAKQCEENSAKFVLIYFPSKGSVYYPLILRQADPELLYRYAEQALPVEQRKGREHFLKRFEANHTNVRDLMRELCEENSIIFIDTTDALIEAAESGRFPFWCYDTHLNESGNEAVGKVILDRLVREGIGREP